jgi:fructokinase
MEAFEGLDALHLGSAALGIDPVGARLLTLMEQLHGRVFLSFDPNIRRDVVDDWHEYLSRLRRAFELADLVKISTVDLAAIGEEDVRGKSGILGRNLPTILTAGAGGSSLHRADHPVIRVPAARTVVRDTIGAGDALMAGLIYALSRHGALERVRIEALSDVDWRAVLTIANTAGAMTCERVGADPPTAEALQARLGTFA